MAIADTITSMQTHTSNAYTMIGYGTDLTGINKNLANLSSTIFEAFLESLRNPDTLFTNLPKKSDTGANITLNDTANAPMRITLGSVPYQQDSTKGDNLLLTTNSNITNGTYVSGANTNQYKIQATGADLYLNNVSSVGGNYSIINGNKIPCNFGETIYYDTGNTLFNRIYITEWDSSDVSLGYYYKQANSSTGTHTPTNSNCSYITLRFGNSSATSGTTYTLAPMVSKSAITNYEPYTGGIPAPNPSYKEDIHTISGSNTIKIESNLFDGAIENKYFNNQNQFINQTGALTTNYIPASEGDKYTISTSISSNGIVIASFDENYNCLSRSATGYDLTLTHTCPAGTKYIIGSNYVGANANTMLNAGNIALPYTPYTLETKDIDLGILGKNYFDGKWEEGGYNSSTGAKNTDTTMRRNVNSIYLQSNEIYIISNNGSGIAMNVLEYKTDGTFIQARTISSGSAFTTASNTAYINIFRGNTNIDKVQIEKGITITSWEAYNPMECGSIGNYENIPIRTSGKNIFEPTANSQSLSSGGSLTKNNGNTYTVSNGRTDFADLVILGTINVKNGKTYYLYNAFSDTNNNLSLRRGSTMIVATSTSNVVSYTATATETLNVYIRYQSTGTFTFTPMVAYSSPTSYEPYGTNEWYIKDKIPKYVFDGTENWVSSQYGTNSWVLDNVLKIDYDTSKVQIMSNIFKGISNDDRATGGDNTIYTYSNNGIIIRNTTLTTLADVQSATSGNYVYYVSSTPTYTQITGTLASQLENVYKNMLSQAGQTNISQVNDDLSFNLSVQAIEEL